MATDGTALGLARRGGASGRCVTNFGGNVCFTPRHVYAPGDEAALLEVLDEHAGGRIRVAGSLHSWSDVVGTDDVLIDMRHFDAVEVMREGGELRATVGAGCRLGRLVRELRESSKAALPSIGAVTRQTLAGATSTGTHGSGRHSLSHYVEEVRVAAYDPRSATARIYEWREGPELLAARCALGCMGVILSLRTRCVPEYDVAETAIRCETLDDVLAAEEEFPLQQFILVPYLWSYFAFRRRPVEPKGGDRRRVGVALHRGYNRLVVDVLFHLLVRALASGPATPGLVRRFYRKAFPLLVLRGRTVVDHSNAVLTMRHDLFRHLEIEVFVPARRLRGAVELVRQVTRVCSGEAGRVAEPEAGRLREIGMLESLSRLAGSYAHHYPLFCRRVLPDDTLISMTSGSDEPYYTISLFTYLKSAERAPFFAFADFLARSLTRLYGARLHWGKYFPLAHAEIAHLYPRLREFRETCARTDPRGAFRNAYTSRVLGFGEA